MKTCSKCGEVKEASEFFTRQTTEDGLSLHCSTCAWTLGVGKHHLTALPKKCRDCGEVGAFSHQRQYGQRHFDIAAPSFVRYVDPLCLSRVREACASLMTTRNSSI